MRKRHPVRLAGALTALLLVSLSLWYGLHPVSSPPPVVDPVLGEPSAFAAIEPFPGLSLTTNSVQYRAEELHDILCSVQNDTNTTYGVWDTALEQWNGGMWYAMKQVSESTGDVPIIDPFHTRQIDWDPDQFGTYLTPGRYRVIAVLQTTPDASAEPAEEAVLSAEFDVIP